MVQWLALLPNSKKVLSLKPPAGSGAGDFVAGAGPSCVLSRISPGALASSHGPKTCSTIG